MRLLPILILVLTVTLGLRIFSLTEQGKTVNYPAIIPDTIAESSEEESDDNGTESDSQEGMTEGDDKEAAKEMPKEGEVSKPNFAKKGEYSQTEIELLQSLSQRREELEGYEKSLDLRETVLKATEERLETKIVELKTLKQDVDALLKTI